MHMTVLQCIALCTSPPHAHVRSLSPSHIHANTHTHCQVDVYSFGIILWEMHSKKLPYSEMTQTQIAVAVATKNHRCVRSACTFTRKHTYTHILTPTHICIRTHTRAHMRINERTNARTNARTRTLGRIFVHICIYICVCTCMYM